MERTGKRSNARKLIKALAVIACAAFTLNFLSASYAGIITRIKDIARIGGVRENQLVGYGVVVGLEGSGDKNIMTAQSIVNMLKSFDVTLDPKTLKAQNSAAVMVTANILPFMSEGDKLDVVVSSIGDAKSIQGGVLLQTPLKGANGKVYAVAQGPVSLGQLGSSQQSAGGVKLHPLVARIPGGALIEREISSDFVADEKIEIVLNKKDFSTASAVAAAICDKFGEGFARAKNAGVVIVKVPSSFEDNVVGFLAAVESLSVQTDNASKIVINEKTGTIVLGDDVKISPVAISHNGIKLKVAEAPAASPAQAQAGAAQNQQAAQANAAAARGKGGEKNIVYLNAGSTVRDMVDALNEMGAYAKDIIAIIQAMKAAGAIQSEIEVI
ncbi:MAG TPA: flagellar basal body P-ring protein FlgI [Candidatus Wallbacteria bacterium]|nr:flagellar basal body P-ring protein FlgI [Candidatus Wallbacteria bacterium]